MNPKHTIYIGVAIATFVLLATTVSAQERSGITGAVRDESQAVLPGVTVEAASPGLIEKIRTVVTDGQGLYNIVALPPGTYTVTFTLPGFRTTRREGIVLSAGFTATVNADMAVGSLEETITVTGTSPLVDTQNVRVQTSVSAELAETLPTATRSFVSLLKLTPGLTGGSAADDDRANSDVGGSSGAYWGNSMSGTFHGRAGIQQFFNGMPITDPGSGGTLAAYVPNSSASEEMILETSGFSAESPSTGVTVNLIPRSGSNTFAFTGSSLYSNHSMQSNNLSDKLRARGVTRNNELQYIYTGGGRFGGPIKRDRVWFFAAPKWDREKTLFGISFYNLTQGTPFYTPDFSRRAPKEEQYQSTAVRLTWQASQKDKLNIFFDYQPYCGCFRGTDIAAEASTLRRGKTKFVDASWIRPVTNRLLLEAGGSFLDFPQSVPGVDPRFGTATMEDISIHDALFNDRPYNANQRLGLSGYGEKHSYRDFQRFSIAYVTGTHAIKAGIKREGATRIEGNFIKQDISYEFRGHTPGNAVPFALILYATPYETTEKMKADVGVFVQDQWRLNQRLTLNLGLRFDWVNMYVPEQHSPAGRYVIARDFAAVKNVPNWKDLNPRVGLAYDLFGNGRTALKTSLSRYVNVIGLGFANAFNPLVTSVNTVTRDWNDNNGNYVPDCDLRNPAANGECGVYQNLNFGGTRPATQWNKGVLDGFGTRDGAWGFTAEVQHELTRNASVLAGYYHNWNFNARVTDNLAVTPQDYSPYFITAPVDTRLPNDGGYRIDGLYDLNPNRVGQVNNIVKHSKDFGKKTTQYSDFFSVSFSTRLGPDIRFGGGIDTGRTVDDNCFVIDSPQLLNCKIVTTFKDQMQVKLFGSYPLPAGFAVSAILNSIAGVPILANYTVTRGQIQGLDRPLSTSSRVIPLYRPNTRFEARNSTLDVQLSKAIQRGRLRVKPTLGIYNALNASPTLVYNNIYGPAWNPQTVLIGRLLQVSAEVSF